MKPIFVLSAITAATLLCAAGQAQVVISQVYGGGGNSGSTFRNDFVELKNNGTTAVNLSGWSVQYASSAGNFQVNPVNPPGNTNFIVPLSGSIAPGGYYLVQLAAGAGGTTNLPTPDATGSIAVAQSNAKIALATITTPVSGQTDAAVVDFVGVGTANQSETTPAQGMNNTNSVSRLDNGCVDTGNNGSDFVAGAPAPRNSATSAFSCGVAFPDVGIQLSGTGCSPALNAGYTVTVQVGNTQSATAANTVATIVLPPALTYVSNTGGATYDSATRTVTWNVGGLTQNQTASMDVATTVNAEAGLVVKGSVSTTTPNDPSGNNSATLLNSANSTAAPLNVIAVGSFDDTSIATSIDEGGFERKLGNLYRVFSSQNGQWIIFRTDLAGLDGAVNGAVIVGQKVGSAWQLSLVAREGTTAPVAALPNAKIDNSGVNNILGINNTGEYVYSSLLREVATPNDIVTAVVVKGTVAGGISQVIKEGDAATAPELAGRTYTNLGSATIQNDGTVSFYALLNGSTTTNSAFLRNNGSTVVIQKGVTTFTGATEPLKSLNNDSSSDGRGFMVSADGLSYTATGVLDTADTAADECVVVNGVVVMREGTPYGSIPGGVSFASLSNVAMPWVQMNPDGSWVAQAYSPTAGTFNQGTDFVVKNGNIVAQTGQATFSTSGGEVWTDTIIQRTFFAIAGNQDVTVVGGLTSRSLPANGSDTATDGLMASRGSSALVREGAPVLVSPSNTRYLNFINDHRSSVAGGTLLLNGNVRDNDDFCQSTLTNLPNVIVSIAIPGAPTCPADIGVQGGNPGQDGLLNNNDFIVFIDLFFAQSPLADRGVQGGQPGSDNQWNNNDFIVFIDQFFAGCGN